MCDESNDALRLSRSNLKQTADEMRGLHLRLSGSNISAQQESNFTRIREDSRKSNLDSLPSSIQISGNDVIIASGCSGAVEMAISVLMNEGDNILVPRSVLLFEVTPSAVTPFYSFSLKFFQVIIILHSRSH